MLHKTRSLFSMCIILILTVKTLQKELGIGQDAGGESNHLSQMKWNSILNHSKTIEFSKDNYNLNILNSLENDHFNKVIKNKLRDGEAKHLSEDEVFIQEVKDIHERPDAKNSGKDISDKRITFENSHNSVPDENNAAELTSKKQIIEEFNTENSSEIAVSKQKSESILKLDNSVLVNQQTNSFNERSFIFNPNAKPQEHFQNCTTPKNESGSCRYLQHCMIPTIVSSLGQFMEYVCIIEERFIGVCCPNLPVSVIVIQNEKEETKSESKLHKECGVGTNRRIVGGSHADPKAWPWMVALLSKLKKFFCGGALINDRYVLTAAHCTFGVFNNEIIARLGEYDFKNDGELHVEYAVTEIKRHGHFDRRSLKNDIALLKLEKPVAFNEFIQTICFPEEEKNYVGEQATLAGWGNIVGGGRTSNVLQQASFPVISNAECSKGHLLPISPSLICTSSESGDKGACNGDSGGPLMLLDKNDRWKVIGLVSWGRRGCSPEFPTVYTRVSHYLEWIKEHSR